MSTGVFFLGGLFMSSIPSAQDAKTPEDILHHFLADVEKAIKNAPGAKNLEPRTKLEVVAKNVFEHDLTLSARPDNPKGIWELHKKLVDNLGMADKKFISQELKAERAAWILACSVVFQREIQTFKEKNLDEDKRPSAEEVFEECVKALQLAKTAFEKNNSTSSADLKKAASTGVNQAFTQLIQVTRLNDKDLEPVYSKRLARIQTVFPINTDKTKAVNTDANAMLKNLAKMIFDKSLALQK